MLAVIAVQLPESREAAMAKKDNQPEQTFFAAPSAASFFKPNVAIQRKCDQCAAEDKQVSRLGDPKEEEKKVQKMDEKKEEKNLQMMEDKKDEKEVQKMEDKQEEKTVQKMSGPKEDEEKVQKQEDKKEEDKNIQKAAESSEEKKINKKENTTAKSTISQTQAYIYSLPGKGSTLPPLTKHFFAQRMGHDFSQVRIHTGTEAEQSAKEMNAKAYAVDNNIVFNKGQYNPESKEGKKLLAHELTHVVQQKHQNMELVSKAIENTINRPEAGKSVSAAGKAANSQNQTAYGCEGVAVQGQTDANYTDSYNTTGTVKPSTKCEDCPDDCVSAKGTVVSQFKANPVVTLPAVPDNLSECETKAVAKFINTTLTKHEQKHVAAFKKYNGKIKTPYKYVGCQNGLDTYLQSVHEKINAKRMAAANAKSAKLDPFNPVIPCKCD